MTDLGGGCRQGMGLEPAPERRSTNNERSPGERPHDEHGSFLVDRTGHDERAEELSEKAESGRIQQALELGHETKSRSD